MATSTFQESQCPFLNRGVAVVANGADDAVAEWHDCMVGVSNVLVVVVVDNAAVVVVVVAVAGVVGSGCLSDHADVDAFVVHAHGSVVAVDVVVRVVVVFPVRVAAVAAVDAEAVHQETRGGSTDRIAWWGQTIEPENEPEAMIATTRTTTSKNAPIRKNHDRKPRH